MREAIKKELLTLQDQKYKAFSLKLLPGFAEEKLIGVRFPLLRKKAKEIVKSNYWGEFLKEEENLFFEEKMLQSMVIGLVEVEAIERIALIDAFLPKIDNWSICDNFSSNLKFAKEAQNQKIVWEYISPYFFDEREYYVRFATVMSLNYFLNKEYINIVLNKYSLVSNKGYYAKMSIAWGVSMAYAKDSEKTIKFLEKGSLDKFTYNKALQKIIKKK